MKMRAFVFQWERECWACGGPTPVVYGTRAPLNVPTAGFLVYGFLESDITPNDDERMGEAIAQRHPFFHRSASRNANDGRRWASHCRLCDAPQGDYYLACELVSLLPDPDDLDDDGELLSPSLKPVPIEYKTDFMVSAEAIAEWEMTLPAWMKLKEIET